jgi:small-conductance mechanosensitive channel
MAILISFLNLLLYIAVIVFIAFCLVWAFRWFAEREIDPDVYKWGKVIVALLCLIAIATWLAGLLGAGPGLPHFLPVYR